MLQTTQAGTKACIVRQDRWGCTQLICLQQKISRLAPKAENRLCAFPAICNLRLLQDACDAGLAWLVARVQLAHAAIRSHGSLKSQSSQPAQLTHAHSMPLFRR